MIDLFGVDLFASVGVAFTVVKGLIILLLVIYTIFAVVVVKQVHLMTDTLEVGFEKPLRMIAILHFALAILTIIVAFVIL